MSALAYILLGAALAPIAIYAMVRLGTAAYFKSKHQFTQPTTTKETS